MVKENKTIVINMTKRKKKKYDSDKDQNVAAI